MKNILLTAFILLGAVANGQNKISIPQFSIDIPENWSYDTSVVKTTIFKSKSPLENDADSFRENLGIRMVSSPASTVSMTEILHETEKSLKQGLNNFELVEMMEMQVDGQKAGTIVFNSDYQDYKLCQMQTYIVHGDEFFVVTFTAERKEYARFQPVFKNMLNSIHFK